MKVKKAIIPAAGLGTRFLPATKAQPKEMLPIVDKPTIQYIIEEAVRSGIEDIMIVTGRSKRAIEDHFDRSLELEEALLAKGKRSEYNEIRRISDLANLHYIRQGEPLGLGHAVWSARKFIGNEPFAVLLGDDIVKSEVPCLRQLTDAYDKYGTSIVGVQKVPEKELHKYGVIAPASVRQLHEAIKIRDLVEKPPLGTEPSAYAIMGRYILEPEIFDHIEQLRPNPGEEVQLTEALRLLNREKPIMAYPFKGIRYDVGDKIGFLRATVDFALERPDLREEAMGLLHEVYRREKRSEKTTV
ncbi:UDP-glucose pyrophosphorylase [Paenibacillus taihuensis]|uniref:UTP--glucose-1-phosphate uridylyltransferase n=1 Tax=Paenibacillus taihuensis TaxID=1156355 RepID=A0A3D9Q3T3_9BACL|nr:UTP--glucose-1-phosphate uridylyltransferase GalU [Paenibacillus taihuensis]REE57507.1 UDP-glucose pyrophosphorylase [Paenibacillus taihuensis]